MQALQEGGRITRQVLVSCNTCGGVDFLDSEFEGGRDAAKLQAVGLPLQQDVCLLGLIVRHAFDGDDLRLREPFLHMHRPWSATFQRVPSSRIWAAGGLTTEPFPSCIMTCKNDGRSAVDVTAHLDPEAVPRPDF